MMKYKRLTERAGNGTALTKGCETCHDYCFDCEYAEGCIERLAELEDKIEEGTLKENEMIKPNCVIDKEKLFVDFICQKCNSTVSFVEIGMLGLIGKSDLGNAQKVETIEQLYPNYCSCCGAKLKELQNG